MGAISGHYALLVAASGAATGIRAGLVSWYDFEEATGATRADSIGSNALTTAGAGAQNGIAGKIGNCVAKGSGTTLEKVTPIGVDFLTGDFTLAQWINTANSNQGGVGRWDVSLTTGRSYCLLIEGGIAKLGVSTDGSTAAATATASSGLSNSAWHLLIGWRSTTDGKIYLQVDNGTPVGVAFSAASTLFNCGRPLVVGGLGSGTYNGAGNYDSTGMWSRELTSTERTALWNSGAGVNYAALAGL